MRRPYTIEKFAGICERMREVRPGISITTDIIVGFPGETEEDYLETRSAVEEIAFDNAFVFRYSKRRDTPAAGLPGQVPDEEKRSRNQDLLAVVARIGGARNAALVGTSQEILCEGPSRNNADRLTGRTSANKIVIFDGDADRLTGELFEVTIRESTGFTLYGEADLAN